MAKIKEKHVDEWRRIRREMEDLIYTIRKYAPEAHFYLPFPGSMKIPALLDNQDYIHDSGKDY